MTHLTTLEILSLMAYDEASRGKSKGLELIYAPIQESNMSRPFLNLLNRLL